MIKLLKMYECAELQFPERRLTQKYLEYKYDIEYIFPLLYKHNIMCYWAKRGFYLNDYEFDVLFMYDYFPK